MTFGSWTACELAGLGQTGESAGDDQPVREQSLPEGAMERLWLRMCVIQSLGMDGCG